MGKKIMVLLLMALFTNRENAQYYFGVLSDTITWISGNDFTIHFEEGIKAIEQDTRLTIKNVLLRKRKAAIKRFACYSNFYDTHIVSNGYKSSFWFKDDKEIKDCQFFGVMKEYYRDEKWLIMLGDMGSGTFISTAYIFYKSNYNCLVLYGLLTGGPIINQGHSMSFKVSDNELIVTLNDEVLFKKKMDEDV